MLFMAALLCKAENAAGEPTSIPIAMLTTVRLADGDSLPGWKGRAVSALNRLLLGQTGGGK